MDALRNQYIILRLMEFKGGSCSNSDFGRWSLLHRRAAVFVGIMQALAVAKKRGFCICDEQGLSFSITPLGREWVKDFKCYGLTEQIRPSLLEKMKAQTAPPLEMNMIKPFPGYYSKITEPLVQLACDKGFEAAQEAIVEWSGQFTHEAIMALAASIAEECRQSMAANAKAPDLDDLIPGIYSQDTSPEPGLAEARDIADRLSYLCDLHDLNNPVPFMWNGVLCGVQKVVDAAYRRGFADGMKSGGCDD